MFPLRSIFSPRLKGFPLELDTGAGSEKKLEWWGYRAQMFDNIFSRVDTIHQRDRRTDRQRSREADRQTDRQTPDDRKDLAYA